MTQILELMRARHSVRQYLDRAIPTEIRRALDAYATELNENAGLHIQILYDEPECFRSRMARYGRFENCANYIAMVGKRGPELNEKCGFNGEKLVLKAQELGLNTCWVALTHGRSRAAVGPGETEAILIALGYGRTQGTARRSKAPADVSDLSDGDPDWYRTGIEAALLAPTAVNQQKFRFRREGNRVSVRAGALGPQLKTDLGIVKCHFELAAGRENFQWV